MNASIYRGRALCIANTELAAAIKSVKESLKRDAKKEYRQWLGSDPDAVSTEALGKTSSFIYFYAEYLRTGSGASREKFYVTAIPKKTIPKSQFPTEFTDVGGHIVKVGDRVYYNGTLGYGGGHPSLCVGSVVAFSAKSVKIRDEHSISEISREFRFVAKAPEKVAQPEPEPQRPLLTSGHAFDALLIRKEGLDASIEVVTKALTDTVVEPKVESVNIGCNEFRIFYTKRGSLIRHWVTQLPTF
jgi:hypothetical protein